MGDEEGVCVRGIGAVDRYPAIVRGPEAPDNMSIIRGCSGQIDGKIGETIGIDVDSDGKPTVYRL